MVELFLLSGTRLAREARQCRCDSEVPPFQLTLTRRARPYTFTQHLQRAERTGVVCFTDAGRRRFRVGSRIPATRRFRNQMGGLRRFYPLRGRAGSGAFLSIKCNGVAGLVSRAVEQPELSEKGSQVPTAKRSSKGGVADVRGLAGRGHTGRLYHLRGLLCCCWSRAPSSCRVRKMRSSFSELPTTRSARPSPSRSASAIALG